MSILDPIVEIDKKFLLENGFYESGWGSPRENQRPQNRFFEKVILLDHKTGDPASPVLDIMYFPNGFDGYQFFGMSKFGRGVIQGQFFVQFDDKYTTFKDLSQYKLFPANLTTDYKIMIGLLQLELKRLGYVMSNVSEREY
jgi:hypothetical protein